MCVCLCVVFVCVCVCVCLCVCVCVCVCVIDKQKVLSDLYIFLNRKKLPLETCLKIRFCTSVRTSICSSVLTTGSLSAYHDSSTGSTYWSEGEGDGKRGAL